jgi:hypothetical protein
MAQYTGVTHQIAPNWGPSNAFPII